MSLRRFIPLVLALAMALPFVVGAKGSKKDRSRAQGELGRAYLSEGSLESAIGTLREAVDLDRGNWAAWSFLGLALAEKGKPEDAEDAFGKAIRHADDRAEPHLNYGLFLFGQGRVDEAIVEYEAALEDLTYRKPAFVLNNLGFALMSQGNHQRAVTSLQEAVRRAPNLCAARFNLGLALQLAGEGDDATKEFEDVITSCEDQAPGAYLQVARIAIEAGRPDEAMSHLQQVITIAPDSDVADAAHELLASMEL